MSKIPDKIKSVVVVGGGHAGTAVARRLSAKLNPSSHSLTLITPRPYMIWRPSLVRLVVTGDEEMASRALMPYDQLFVNGNGKVMIGTVESVEDQKNGGSVFLKNGQKVPYDILVLATGANWDVVDAPDDRQDARDWFKECSSRIKSAKAILIVGGGAIGTEISGEIKDVYPEKEVTIVHGSNLLLNRAYPVKFRQALTDSVVARGTNVVLDDYVYSVPGPDSSEVTTRKRKTIRADLVLQTCGPRPATKFLSSLPSVLNSTGHVRVNPTLQLVDYPCIFAAGDIIEWDEQKQAGKVGSHADVITANVVSILNGKYAKKVYKSGAEMILVSNGKEHGVSFFGVLWGLIFGDWTTRLLKSKDLHISEGRGYMNLRN